MLFFALLKYVKQRKLTYHDEDVIFDDTYPPNVRVLADDDSSDNTKRTPTDTIHNEKSERVIDHHGFNFSLYETTDPGFVITSAAFPDHVFTIFDVENYKRQILPINLAMVSEINLKNQIFHAYFRKRDRGVWFEWERTKDIYMKAYSNDSSELETAKVIASGLEVHATRRLMQSDQLFMMQKINGSPYFRIKSNGRCLTVADYKNNNRNAYPLIFISCNEDIEQEFSFVSVLKTVCLLGLENLCGRDEQASITTAEDIIRQKVESLCS